MLNSHYLKPVDWEEVYAILETHDGTAYGLWLLNIDAARSRLIGTGATPAATARLIKEKTHDG